MRSSAGALFRVPVVRGVETFSILNAIKQKQINLIGLSGKGNKIYTEINYSAPFAILLGNESRGLDPTIFQEMDHLAVIPMDAGVESLNVATAASIVSFEAKRQRA